MPLSCIGLSRSLRAEGAVCSAWAYWSDIATANNTVAIVMANPIAKEMSKDYGISSRKAASILDTFSCVFQGILPYGAQMLVAIAAASGLGETVNAFEIMPKLFYPYMLLISSLLFIFFGKEKQK